MWSITRALVSFRCLSYIVIWVITRSVVEILPRKALFKTMVYYKYPFDF